ncbi:MAG: YnbE family lipoprotein [Oligoflexia bacterium]|nr:YnbE family lipoprotein [Oligoflexia bacterium]
MRKILILPFFLFPLVSSTGCTPRVELAAPEKPITINMNLKIDHEVRVKVERDLDQVISKDSKLF